MYRDELAFFQAIRAVLTKADPTSKLDDEASEHALRQIISKAVVSSDVVDIFSADIKGRFATNVVQSKKFSKMLQSPLTRYRNRGIETAQVIEELIAMGRQTSPS